MKLYVVAIISSVLMLSGLPALAKDRDNHHRADHGKAQYSQQREHHNRWGNNGHKQERHNWQKRRHLDNFSHNGRRYYGEKHFSRPHFSNYDRAYRNQGWSKRRSNYCKHHRRHHDHRSSHLAGGIFAGVLLNEYLQGRHH